MNILRTAAVSLFYAYSFPLGAFAQALGIEMGAKESELVIVKEIGNFSFVVDPPRTVSGFDSYVVKATPEAGVCMVKGIGEQFPRDGYGIAVRNRFDKLRGLLDQNYGDGKLHSGLRPGAFWDEVDQWVMAIRQNERYHQAEWEVNDPVGLDDIILSVLATSPDSSLLVLQYRFANITDCDAEAAAADASGL